MTRIKISAAILLLMLSVSIFSGVWINWECNKLISSANELAELYVSDNAEETVRAAEELESQWESFRKKASVLMNNSKLAETDRICSRIKYLAADSGGELIMQLTELRHMLELLKSGETPKLTSVF